jgi:hypothetical protein
VGWLPASYALFALVDRRNKFFAEIDLTVRRIKLEGPNNSNQEFGYFRPLCAAHYKYMVISSSPLERAVLCTTRDWYECRVDKCPQNYPPTCGYLIVEPNDEYWQATGSRAFRFNRNPTQVICGEHKDVMFLESFDPDTRLENFRCPRVSQHTMKIKAGGAPASWLSGHYFRNS